MFKLILKERAIYEIKTSYIYYETESGGLGGEFEKVLNRYFDILETKPLQFRKSYHNFREIVVKEFPFLIIYMVSELRMEVVVYSIFHTSRNPNKKFKK